jgi:tetratricopeptide (TPR) repeat protein
MRRVVEWSHDLLDDDERVAFRRLAVFSGGFTLEAAEAVWEPEGRAVLEVVTSLLDKSLLVASIRDEDEARFGMLETIRAYGLEKLETDEEGEIRARHARYYLGLAEEAEPRLIGAGRDAWTERLEAEHDNLRSALSWSIWEGRTELAWPLAGALFWFWYHGGYWSEGRAWLERALEKTAAGAPTSAAWIKALYSAGAMACVQGDYAVAFPRLEESAALWRALGDNPKLAYALIFLSIATMGRGEVERARALAEESVALFRKGDDAFGLAAALSALGVVFRARGDYGAARSALEESAEIAREAGDDWLLALPLRSLGVVTLKQGDAERAETYLKESLLLSVRRSGEEYFVAQALEVLATIAAGRSDHLKAAHLYGAAEALREDMGSSILPYDVAEQERGMAAAREALGEEGFEAAWAEGEAMTQEQMIAEAIGASPSENHVESPGESLRKGSSGKAGSDGDHVL